jgi:hypothetical protein
LKKSARRGKKKLLRLWATGGGASVVQINQKFFAAFFQKSAAFLILMFSRGWIAAPRLFVDKNCRSCGSNHQQRAVDLAEFNRLLTT